MKLLIIKALHKMKIYKGICEGGVATFSVLNINSCKNIKLLTSRILPIIDLGCGKTSTLIKVRDAIDKASVLSISLLELRSI